MQTGTLLLIILAGLIALAIAWFQYFYRPRTGGKFYLILAFLRFLAVFGVLLLLINPSIVKTVYNLEKTDLVVLLDNSSSVNSTNANSEIAEISRRFGQSRELSDRFNLNVHSFGTSLNSRDSLSFDEKITNISKTLGGVEDVYGRNNTTVVLATDGNQTYGPDYEFYGRNGTLPIYPVVVGDTTRFEDLRIDKVNTNRYAFLKNKFPIEVFTSYQGERKASALLTISMEGQQLYRERLDFSPDQKSHLSNALIEASAVGTKNISVALQPLENERNKLNNRRVAVVEIVDEKTEVVIVSSIPHPDIGALSKAITSNEQRSVTVRKPDVSLSELEEADLFILFQPNASFRRIYDFISKKAVNTWTITGPKTDWGFLNGMGGGYEKNSYQQDEEVTAVVNSGFSFFDISDFSVEDFPPLETSLGEVLITRPYETLLGQVIKGVEINEPLLAILSSGQQKQAVLFGEHIWKWRMQSYRNEGSFENFDQLIGKLLRYLTATKPNSRLSLEYSNSYASGSGGALFTATYFDEAFIFDPNATISLRVKQKEDTSLNEIPMLLKKGYYEADLSALPAGEYQFTVMVSDSEVTRSGQFRILDFDVEQQLLSSDYRKLERLSKASGGALYFADQLGALMDDLQQNDRFAPIRKSDQNVVSLIDFRILLGIIVLALAAEWLLRKYNGLI
ncbi:vWA domain-containing protein [Poritiphilus flavus]|uniref:VWA domain-containing protein n=1 Tax=Poritiphilus flavus TaxID=2697053 RepID=A0A6L9EG08_9FLAO|nr:vWA domain-containing protein [Poritiphilus flavus]NAS13613.1 VWA domain-containing protein [Poritiphilus flavus]